MDMVDRHMLLRRPWQEHGALRQLHRLHAQTTTEPGE